MKPVYLRGTAVFLLFLIASQWARAEALPADDLLRAAGEQRVLTQVLLKNYCQIALEVRFLAAREERERAIAAFDVNLTKLKTLDLGGELWDNLSGMETAWGDYRKALLRKPSKEAAVDVEELATQVGSLADAVYSALLSTLDAPHKRVLDLINRQSLLAQSAAALYLLTAWDVEPEIHAQAFNTALSKFDSNMHELSTLPENNKESIRNLRSLSKKWELFKVGHHIDEGDLVPDFVVRICDSVSELLEHMLLGLLKN